MYFAHVVLGRSLCEHDGLKGGEEIAHHFIGMILISRGLEKQNLPVFDCLPCCACRSTRDGPFREEQCYSRVLPDARLLAVPAPSSGPGCRPGTIAPRTLWFLTSAVVFRLFGFFPGCSLSPCPRKGPESGSSPGDTRRRSTGGSGE